MKICKNALGLSLVLFLNASCFADTKVTVDYNSIKIKDTDIDVNPAALSAGLEYAFNENFSLIGKYGVGISDDSQTTFAGNTKFEVDYLYSFYAKGALTTDSDFKPYVLLGFSKTKMTGSVGNFEFGQTDDGFSYAIGVDYLLNKSLSFNLDYTQLINNSDIDMSSINLGLGYSF